jgi:hypothetical protein
MSPRTLGTLLGVAALLAGLVLLFTPVSATVGDVPVGCGTAARADLTAATVKDDSPGIAAAVRGLTPTFQTTFEDACGAALSGRRTIVWILIPVAAIVLVAARGVRWRQSV